MLILFPKLMKGKEIIQYLWSLAFGGVKYSRDEKAVLETSRHGFILDNDICMNELS